MSTLATVAALRAAETGRAERPTTVRHAQMANVRSASVCCYGVSSGRSVW